MSPQEPTNPPEGTTKPEPPPAPPVKWIELTERTTESKVAYLIEQVALLSARVARLEGACLCGHPRSAHTLGGNCWAPHPAPEGMYCPCNEFSPAR
jgi:hypothetical protein